MPLMNVSAYSKRICHSSLQQLVVPSFFSYSSPSSSSSSSPTLSLSLSLGMSIFYPCSSTRRKIRKRKKGKKLQPPQVSCWRQFDQKEEELLLNEEKGSLDEALFFFFWLSLFLSLSRSLFLTTEKQNEYPTRGSLVRVTFA
jgi:hypothetical protein